jgi:nucleoside-diphosphate-sugar epimerase
MLADEKILITGPSGQIAFPLASYLARDNEVWGIARFGTEGSRERVEAAGVRTAVCDLAAGNFGSVPDDFTYVVHLAAFQGAGLDYDEAIRVNAEGTGLLLAHCRQAKAALVMSTHSVYKPHEDYLHVYRESDPLGDVNATHCPTYSVSKIAEEGVARSCARALELPTVITRMNAAYGATGGLPVLHMDAIIAGDPVVTRWDPCLYMPIHQDDINAQVESLLGAASVPAAIVNWAGDEVVSAQQWCRYAGELAKTQPSVVAKEIPGTLRGSIADVSRRVGITGPCRVGWKDGMRRAFGARHAGR